MKNNLRMFYSPHVRLTSKEEEKKEQTTFVSFTPNSRLHSWEQRKQIEFSLREIKCELVNREREIH